MDHLINESSVIQLMVKNCLFEERIIAKEQGGQCYCFFFSFFSLKNRALISIAFQLHLDFCMRQARIPAKEPGSGTWKWVMKRRQLPWVGFWKVELGLGQSAGQSSGSPILLLECSHNPTEPSELCVLLAFFLFNFKSVCCEIKHIYKKVY